jgi:hypothetical protein
MCTKVLKFKTSNLISMTSKPMTERTQRFLRAIFDENITASSRGKTDYNPLMLVGAVDDGGGESPLSEGAF